MGRRVWTVLGAVLAAYLALLAVSAGRVGEPNPFVTGRVLNIAHQGGELEAPSNTLPAYRRARALGADMLDADLHLTRDGALVFSHDGTLDRLTDARGAIRDLTLAQVQAADAGYAFTPDGGRTHPYRGRGVRVATLAEFLATFPDAPATIEIKEAAPGVGERFCAALRGADATARVIVASFSDAALRDFRAACPEVMTSMTERELRPVVLLGKLGLAGLAPLPGRAAQVPERAGGLAVVTPAFVRAMHRRGVAVQVWTVNDEAAMRRLIDMGVDGIFTDRPTLLKRVLAGP